MNDPTGIPTGFGRRIHILYEWGVRIPEIRPHRWESQLRRCQPPYIHPSTTYLFTPLPTTPPINGFQHPLGSVPLQPLECGDYARGRHDGIPVRVDRTPFDRPVRSHPLRRLPPPNSSRWSCTQPAVKSSEPVQPTRSATPRRTAARISVSIANVATALHGADGYQVYYPCIIRTYPPVVFQAQKIVRGSLITRGAGCTTA